MEDDPIRHRLAARGAALFGLGMVTGFWTALAMTGRVKVTIPHLALAAHLSGLLGGLWLIALASTLPLLSYADRGKRRLALITLVPTYGNWLLTLVASGLGVRGLEFTGDRANDRVALALEVVVVVPTLLACAGWVWGFRRRA